MTNDLRKLLRLALATLALVSSTIHGAASGSFTLVESLKQFRRLHTATLLGDGRVLVAGGVPLSQAAISELFDPITQSWTNSGTLAVGRELHTATLLQDGRVVVTGGQTANQLLGSTELYHPRSGQWIGAGALNQARELHSATILNSGLVLVAGGFPSIA